MRTIRGVPSSIPHRERVTLRGEVLIFRKDLKFNAEREEAGLEPFANPRNAAAGAVRMLDPREVAKRPLRALFYQVVEGPKLHASHSESLSWMAAQGIPSHRLEKTATTFEELAPRLAPSTPRATSYPYETDGAVVKVDDYRQEDILGFTSKFPKWAIAYKFAAEQARTIVRDVIVQVGRTGALTPVAVLDPVELGGDDRVARVAPQRRHDRPARRAARRRGLHSEGGGDHPAGDRRRSSTRPTTSALASRCRRAARCAGRRWRRAFATRPTRKAAPRRRCVARTARARRR